MVLTRNFCSLFILLSSILMLSGGAVHAADNLDAGRSIPADKLKVIKDLLVASRTTQNARVGFDLVFGQEMRGIAISVTDQIDRNPTMTASQKAEAKQAATDAINRRSNRFSQLVTQELRLDEAIESVFIPMFDKNFSTSELKQMVAYYNSPIGQKSLDLLPKMSTEAAGTLNAQIIPKLREISAQIDAEEQASRNAQSTNNPQPATQP